MLTRAMVATLRTFGRLLDLEFSGRPPQQAAAAAEVGGSTSGQAVSRFLRPPKGGPRRRFTTLALPLPFRIAAH